jgi:hypothetical protein
MRLMLSSHHNPLDITLAVLIFLLLASLSDAWAQPVDFDGFAASYQIDGSVGVSESFLIDFNTDGALDLVEVYGAPEGVRTFFNDGSGGLDLAAEFVLPDEPFTVTMGDANGDGLPDLAWAEWEGSGSFSVKIYYGEPGGGFHIGQTLRRANNVAALAFGHIDTDAVLDLVVAQKKGSLEIYTAGSDGLLERTVRIRQKARDTTDVAIGDFDGDGDQDVITSTRSGSLYFFAQGSQGRFSGGVRISTEAQYIRKILALDLNGDPFADLLLSTGESIECPDYVYHGNGGASFTLVQVLCNQPDHNEGTADLDVADLNDDGLLDVVALRGRDFYYLGLADGTFGPETPAFTPSVTWARGIVLGDVNDDGVGDALVRDGTCCNTATHVYLGTVVP